MKRLNTSPETELNEFIPSGYLTCTVNSNFYKNIFSTMKINNSLPWTQEWSSSIDYSLEVDWISNKSNSYYGLGSGNYLGGVGSAGSNQIDYSGRRSKCL